MFAVPCESRASGLGPAAQKGGHARGSSILGKRFPGQAPPTGRRWDMMSSQRDSDRPRERKSWREIDKARDTSVRREDRERAAGFQGNSTAYDKYKKNLEKLWGTAGGGGGKLMELVEQRVGAPPSGGAPADAPELGEPQRAVIRRGNEDQAKEREARDALKKAATPLEIKTAVAAYLTLRPQLPDDLELLGRALGSPVEEHQLQALRGLEARTELGAAASSRLIKSRLGTILLTASQEDTRALANSLKARLG